MKETYIGLLVRLGWSPGAATLINDVYAAIGLKTIVANGAVYAIQPKEQHA